ncbi:hypothetical protein G4G27_11925 [Sphingomonas sp. So64.6b]|uniref:hypothetical protein n=1 Tax=Sphingomonas sp. So64.6b TaxID=2997354 RepID=UPI0015FFC83A|nr:hypothetical protein [Sphingomonas sp. So64.6b]QNA84614.1 hypothetical protein G4G27_11925 [Sphingomonas sp. So64.6b]
MPNKRWSEEDVVDLRARVARGDSVPVIAGAIGRSQEATRARMQMLGLTTPRSFKRERLRLAATEDVMA